MRLGFSRMIVILLVFSGWWACAGLVFAQERRAEASKPAVQSVPVHVGTEIRIRLLDKLSTRRSSKGDPFAAELLDDLPLSSGWKLARGTRIEGKLRHVKRAGRISGRAEMKLDFETLRCAGGQGVPIEALLVSVSEDRARVKTASAIEAESDTRRDTRSVGVSSGIGALIGSIKGGGKGAVVGAGAGGAVGLAGVLATRGRDLELNPETVMVIRLLKTAEVPLETLDTLP